MISWQALLTYIIILVQNKHRYSYFFYLLFQGSGTSSSQDFPLLVKLPQERLIQDSDMLVTLVIQYYITLKLHFLKTNAMDWKCFELEQWKSSSMLYSKIRDLSTKNYIGLYQTRMAISKTRRFVSCLTGDVYRQKAKGSYLQYWSQKQLILFKSHPLLKYRSILIQK